MVRIQTKKAQPTGGEEVGGKYQSVILHSDLFCLENCIYYYWLNKYFWYSTFWKIDFYFCPNNCNQGAGFPPMWVGGVVGVYIFSVDEWLNFPKKHEKLKRDFFDWNIFAPRKYSHWYRLSLSTALVSFRLRRFVLNIPTFFILWVFWGFLGMIEYCPKVFRSHS